MTAIHQQIVRQREPTGHVSLAGLELAWDVLPDTEGVRRVLGSMPAARARLVLAFADRTVRAFLEVRQTEHGPAARTPIGDGLPISVMSASEELAHVDVPNVLRATIKFGDGISPRVIYARTTLLASLGFPGGSYDRPEASRG